MIPSDLRIRLVTLGLTVTLVSQIDRLAPAATAVVAATLIALAHGKMPWRRLVHLEGFLALLFLSLPFTVPGAPVLSIGPLDASMEGFARAATVLCKVTASVILIAVFLAGIEPVRIGAALRDLGVPERLVRLFVMTARYLGLVRDEARRLTEAMRARGFCFRSNWHTWRSLGYVVGMLLVRAMGRAERVEEAMLCRGYDGRFLRTAAAAPAKGDWVGLGLNVTGAGALLVLGSL